MAKWCPVRLVPCKLLMPFEDLQQENFSMPSARDADGNLEERERALCLDAWLLSPGLRQELPTVFSHKGT